MSNEDTTTKRKGIQMNTPDLLQALNDLIEAADSMKATYTRKDGKTPLDDDLYMHEQWAEEFLAERADAARAAAIKAEKAQDVWQPIETAPKDGTVIDLWHEEFGREADCYWGLPHHCCGEMGSLCDSEWHSLEPGWVGAFNEITFPASEYTHWMPLPTPPVAQGAKP